MCAGVSRGAPEMCNQTVARWRDLGILQPGGCTWNRPTRSRSRSGCARPSRACGRRSPTRRSSARWFGVKLDGEFVAGKPITGTFDELDEAAIVEAPEAARPRAVEGEAAREPHAVFCTVERIEPERYFSFRWIPYGIDAEADPAERADHARRVSPRGGAEGTLLTIVESGFDRVPAHRRERAFRMNEGGWAGAGGEPQEVCRGRAEPRGRRRVLRARRSRPGCRW